MQDIQRILVPVDFSPCSAAALEYALAFARPFGAKIEVLHVWTAPAYVSPTLAVQIAETRDMATLEMLARRDAEEQMAQLLARVASETAGAELSTRIESGDPIPVILEVSHTCDLIIAGTHGRSGVSHLILGSVVEKLARASVRPVLAVRCKQEPKRADSAARPHAHYVAPSEPPIRRILAAVDFSNCSRFALQHAVFLQQRLGASLDILHAVTHVPIEGAELLVTGYAGESRTPFKEWAKSRAEKEMEDFLEGAPGVENAELHLLLGEPVETTLDHLQRGGHDLLVLGTHGRTGFSRLLMGSIAERLMRRASCPVLLVREPPAAPPSNTL